MVQPDVEQMKFASLVPSWHHVDCFLDNLAELEAVGVVPEELSGFTKLKADGKREVMEKFEAVESGLKRRQVGRSGWRGAEMIMRGEGAVVGEG